MKKKLAGIALAGALAAVLLFSVATYDWGYDDKNPTGVEIGPDDAGNLQENSLSFAIFETNGALVFVLAVLMFAAILGGVVISREEVDNDDSD